MRVDRRVQALLDRLGIAIVSDKKQPLWTGSAINMAWVLALRSQAGAGSYSVSNSLLHEVGHFACAPEELRGLANFGWVDAPVGPRVEANVALYRYGRARNRSTEELDAQVLGYMAMRALSLPGWRQQAALDFWNREDELLKAARKLPAALIDRRALRPRFMDE